MKAEKKRQDIINTGMDLFIRRGFSKVSVEDICRELKISKPTLYKYIRKKEMILACYYQQHALDSLPRVYAFLDEDQPREALQSLFDSLCSIAQGMGPELYGVYRSFALTDRDYLSIYSRPQVRVLELSIRDLQIQKRITSQSTPHKLAMILMDLFEGLCLSWASGKGSFPLRDVFYEYARVSLGLPLNTAADSSNL